MGWRQWRDGQALLSVFLLLLYFAIVEAYMYVEGVHVLVAVRVRLCGRTPMNARQDQRFDSKNNDWRREKRLLGSIIGWIGWHSIAVAGTTRFESGVSCAASVGGPRQLALIT